MVPSMQYAVCTGLDCNNFSFVVHFQKENIYLFQASAQISPEPSNDKSQNVYDNVWCTRAMRNMNKWAQDAQKKGNSYWTLYALNKSS